MSEVNPGEEVYPRPYGAYVLLERIDSGGIVNVDLAQRAGMDPRFAPFVVIKRLRAEPARNPAVVHLFRRAAQICAVHDHPNVGRVQDFGDVDSELFVQMEYIPGVHLRHVQRILASRGQVPPYRVTFRVLADMLSAMASIHAWEHPDGLPRWRLHGDVNPRNVMLSVAGDVKLIGTSRPRCDQPDADYHCWAQSCCRPSAQPT